MGDIVTVIHTHTQKKILTNITQCDRCKMGLGQDMLFLSQTNKGGLFTDRGKNSGRINGAHFTAELELCQGIRECCGDRREEETHTCVLGACVLAEAHPCSE